jgi:hypothetical protein
MPDLHLFMNEFAAGFQQTSRFLVQIFVQPEMITNILADLAPVVVVTGATFRTSTDTTSDALTAVNTWLQKGLLATTARLPDRGFATTELMLYGITEHIPYHAETSPLDITFQMPLTTTGSMFGRQGSGFHNNGVPRFFWQWQNQIQNMLLGPDSGFDFRFPSNYYATMFITLADRQNQETATYQFNKVYPATVASVPLSWEDSSFAHLPVSFRYSTYQMLAENGSQIGP